MPQTTRDEEILLTKDELQNKFGDSGTRRYSGFYSEEPNVKWRDSQRITNVEEMRRADGPIKGLLNAIKSPILSAEWMIVGGDEEVRQFVQENLFNMAARPWRKFLREALAYLDFGFYVFELIWDIKKDGKAHLIDLAPRIPRSIQKWQMDNGNKGVCQQLSSDNTGASTANIPWDKLLVLTNDMEGDDVTGQSVLRPAFKHWVIKDTLYRIQAIAAERYGVGIPILYLDPEATGAGDAEKGKGEELLRNIRSNEQAFAVLPWKKENGQLEILTPNGNPQGAAIETSVEHHNKMILLSVLAGFLGLGTDGTGSFALSKDQSSFFLKHVEDKAHYLAGEITEQVIKKIVFLNFGPNVEVPRLTFTPLGDIDFQEYSQVIERLVNMNMLTNDVKTEQFVRKTFKLPELTEEEIENKEQSNIEEDIAVMEGDSAADEFDFVNDGFDTDAVTVEESEDVDTTDKE